MYDPSSQQNIGGSSSPRPTIYPIHPFSFDDLPMYEPQISPSMFNPVDESPIEEVLPRKKKSSKIHLKLMRMSIVTFHGPLHKTLHCAKVGFIHPKIAPKVIRRNLIGFGSRFKVTLRKNEDTRCSNLGFFKQEIEAFAS